MPQVPPEAEPEPGPPGAAAGAHGAGAAARTYRWSGENRHFLFSHKTYFAMGSGGRHGLWLDDEFLHGSSGRSATFGNACLCDPPPAADGDAAAAQSSEAAPFGEFTCDVFEAWGLEPSVIAKRQRDVARERIIQTC